MIYCTLFLTQGFCTIVQVVNVLSCERTSMRANFEILKQQHEPVFNRESSYV